MKNLELNIPLEIADLINRGIWPKDPDVSMSQNGHMIISEESLKKLAPDENHVYFYSPPFRTIKAEMTENADFWYEFGAIESIYPEKCLLIGDFGLGSDTVIILDYSKNDLVPVVKRLVWSQQGNYWSTIAKSLNSFIEQLEFKEKRHHNNKNASRL